MPIVYQTCTPKEDRPKYNCEPCNTTEKGRVRGAFYLEKSLLSEATEENLTDISWWETQIAAETVLVTPKVRGDYDGGNVNTTDGFGDEIETVVDKTHIVTYRDKNHKKGNDTFYGYLDENGSDYVFGFISANQLRIASEPITRVEASDPIEEDGSSTVLFDITVTWNQNIPRILPIIDLTGHDDIKELFSKCIDSVTPDTQSTAAKINLNSPVMATSQSGTDQTPESTDVSTAKSVKKSSK